MWAYPYYLTDTNGVAELLGAGGVSQIDKYGYVNVVRCDFVDSNCLDNCAKTMLKMLL